MHLRAHVSLALLEDMLYSGRGPKNILYHDL